jgi:steroid delta-isomerase-like uncharacterized protein
MSTTAAALVDRLYAAYNAHRASDAAALYRDDGTHEEIANGRRAQGRDAVADGLARFLAAFPDARWEVDVPFTHESGAAVPYRLTGSLAAPLGPIPAAGQHLDLRGVLVVHTAGDAIAATEDYWDAATFRAQMRPATENRPE